jgi:thioredoxin-like negative regulator of GroEL
MIIVNSLSEIEEYIKENKYVLLFAGDSACSTSRALDNKIEEFAEKNPQVKVLFTLLEAMPALASQHMIFTAPAVILFIDGKEVYREGRFVEFEKLARIMGRF